MNVKLCAQFSKRMIAVAGDCTPTDGVGLESVEPKQYDCAGSDCAVVAATEADAVVTITACARQVAGDYAGVEFRAFVAYYC